MSTQPRQQERAPDISERIEQFWEHFQNSLIWQSMVRLKWFFLLVLALVIGTTVIVNMVLSTTAELIDDAVLAQAVPMGPILQRLAILFCLMAIVGFGSQMVISWITIRMEYDLRLWLYRGLHSLDPHRLNSVASGQMVTRAMTDLYLLMIFILLLPALIVTSSFIVGRLIWLFMQNIPMTIVAFLGIPLNLWLAFKMRTSMWGFSWLTLNRRAEITTAFDETVRGMRVVKAFGREDAQRNKLKEVAVRTFGAVMARTRYLAKFDFFMKLGPMVINVLLVFMAARFASRGLISIGVLIVYLGAARSFATFAATFDSWVSAWQFAKTGAGRIYELIGLLDTNVEVQRGGDPLPPASSGLEVEDLEVWFDDYPAVEGVSFDAGYGELVAIIGPPRSGRSTIAKVLAGAEHPTEGAVYLDDADLTTLHPAEVRRAVVLVPEESFLFNRTLRENLALGARGEEVSDEELLDAVWAAGAEDVVANMDAGLDTIVADRGMNMSGGERQRLALARALVLPPRVLVLDDALTAVNPAFEIEILERVKEYAPDTAVVVLSRRDSATVPADLVVRLPEPAEGGPPGAPPVELGPYGTMQDLPYDPRLINIIRHKLPVDSDRPTKISEGVCNWSEEPPGLRNVLAPMLGPVLAVCAVLGGFTAIGLIPPYLYGQIIDAIEQRDVFRSDMLALALAAVGLAWASAAYFLRIWRNRVGEYITYVLRRRVMHRITRLGVDYFDKEAPGYMSTRVVRDIDTVANFVDSGVYKAGTTLLQFFIVLGVLLVWSWPVALVAVSFAPILLGLSFYFLPHIARAYVRVRTETGEVVNRLQEDFMGRYELQAFGQRTRSYQSFDEKAWKLVRAKLWSAFIGRGYATLISLMMNLAEVMLLWMAGMQVLAAIITVGALTTFRQYIDQILDPLPDMANVVEDYLEVRASILRLRQPFVAPIHPPERPGQPADRGDGSDGSGSGEETSFEGEIVFDRVGFTYPGTTRRVLEDISLEIAPGEMVAIVGPTGAGKSSVVKLAARIYDPNDGAILVDGDDLRDLDYTTYRRRLGYVPQETFLFRATVKENLTYGYPEASDEEVERAARQVGAYEAITAIPGGFGGMVQEDGKNLTAGQRQLIALVRAWLVDPDILILDEATAVLDEKLEAQVIKTVRELERTTLLITHRLHVAKEADRLVVVDAGMVVEEGSHDELIRADGVYASLWAYGAEVDSVSMSRSGARSKGDGKKKAPAAAGNGKASKASSAKQSNGTRNGRRSAGTKKKTSAGAKKTKTTSASGSRSRKT